MFADPTPTPQDRGIVGTVLHWLGEGIGVVRPADDDFIKRVIALPGETWEIRDGVTYIDGRKLDEPYVNQADLDTRSFGPETVPDGMLFVMGDNRNHSGDSRFPPPARTGLHPDRPSDRAGVRHHLAPVTGGMAALTRDLDRYERALREQGFTRIAGVDEAGRGALAGSARGRRRDPARGVRPARGSTTRRCSRGCSARPPASGSCAGAVAFAVRKIEPGVIDARGLHRSNIALLRRCVNALDVEPDYVLTDGFPVPRMPCLSLGIKKGDAVAAQRRGRRHRRQGHARRVDAPPPPPLPGVRVRPQQGVRHARALGGAGSARAHADPPPVLRGGRASRRSPGSAGVTSCVRERMAEADGIRRHRTVRRRTRARALSRVPRRAARCSRT